MILKKLLSKEAVFIVIVILIEVGIFWFLKEKIQKPGSTQDQSSQFSTEEDEAADALAEQNPDGMPAKAPEEEHALNELENAAKSQSWEEFEMKRKEMANGLLKKQVQPTTGTALYFFPEVLPEGTFEKNFATYELYPELAKLKQAYDSGSKKNVQGAFQLLENRVQNYELGAHTPADDLSHEAKKFLEIYQDLVTH